MPEQSHAARLAAAARLVQFPGWCEVPGLVHGTTTRPALPEAGKQDLFDLVVRLRGDDLLPRRFTLGGEQIHGDHIAVVDQPIEFGAHPPGFRWDDAGQIGEFAETDALVTNIPGVMLAIQTADCLPVLLVDAPTRMVGLAHCGWRGLDAGLAGATVRAMEQLGARPSRMEAWLGPAIRVGHYEVGAELVERFRAACPGATVSPDGCCLDLPAVAAWQLEQAGLLVEKIYDSGEDTRADPARYHSYRAEGEAAGRMLSFLAFDPAD